MLYDGFTYFSQTVGVMSALPNEVPDYVPYNNIASSKEWLFYARSLFHNAGQTFFHHLPHLDDLSAGDSVELLITATGDLHIFLNGLSGQRLATGLPINQCRLWGVADVCGECARIKSEMLSGNLGMV